MNGGVTITLGTGTYDGGVTIGSQPERSHHSRAGRRATPSFRETAVPARGTVIHAECCQVTLSGLTITGGTNSGIVNDVANEGDSNPQSGLTLDNVSVQGNTSPSDGGGILNEGPIVGARLTLNDSTVTDNAAARNGGGIANNGSSQYPLYGYVTMEQSTISDNCAGYAVDNSGVCSSPTGMSGDGGGLYIEHRRSPDSRRHHRGQHGFRRWRRHLA